jgi:Flp pilus assembly protein CpaB
MQILRSSRGMTIIGVVLAVVAAVLVVVLLSSKSNSPNASAATPTPSGPTDTETPILPTATPTFTLAAITAVQNVPAGTHLNNLVDVFRYFKDQPLSPNTPIDSNAVTSGTIGWLTNDTKVLSGTAFLGGSIVITQPIKSGSPLLTTQYRVLPLPPPNSMAWQMDPGRVAESISIATTSSDDLGIVPGDFVDVLLTLRQKDLDSFTVVPPNPADLGHQETQQLISDSRVISALDTLGGGAVYTLEMPVQDAVLLKYAKNTGGDIDLVLVSAADVKTEAASPSTKAVLPEYYLTPRAIVRGTPGNNGVPYPFDSPRPTFTPVATPAPPK